MSSELNNRMRWAFASVIGAALVFALVLYLHRAPPIPAPLQRAKVSPVVAGRPMPPVDYASPDPTGKASLRGTASSVSDDVVRLQLFATFPGNNSREGTAVLGTDKLNPQTYGAGSVLASGAVIEEVFRDYIVLRFNGAHTRLYVAGIKNSPVDDTALLATTVGGPGIADKPVETHPSSQEDYADILRPRLVFDGEKISGFAISAGRRPSDLAALGLEAGDVVRSIGGHPISADADWQRIQKILGNGGSIVLGIERKGDLLSISMDASQIGKSAVTAMAPPMAPNS